MRNQDGSFPILPERCSECTGKIIPGKCYQQSTTTCGWECTRCPKRSFDKYEHPELTIGRSMAPQYKGINGLDKRITCLPQNMQLGILRENQTK